MSTGTGVKREVGGGTGPAYREGHRFRFANDSGDQSRGRDRNFNYRLRVETFFVCPSKVKGFSKKGLVFGPNQTPDTQQFAAVSACTDADVTAASCR